MPFSIRNTLHLLIVCLLVLSAYIVRSQDIGYPETEEEQVSKQNAAHRKPVFIPGRCRENELLYPGDQDNDWICDCSPGHLFHPPSDRCYPAYRQGPCPPSSYLVLPRDRVIPECRLNRCKKDGDVLVRNKCYPLGEPGPCPEPDLSFVLGVNGTTLDLTCVRLSVVLGNRMGFEEETTTPLPIPTYVDINKIPLCAKGCKRYINGTCPSSNLIQQVPGGREASKV